MRALAPRHELAILLTSSLCALSSLAWIVAAVAVVRGSVAVPRVKEPRFLQAGRFQQTTVSRYKVNFDVVIPAPEKVTFDASPVYLRSSIARDWMSRWMPAARLIVMVRNPVQRSYSHWKMGREWMDSKCTTADELARLAPIMPELTFERSMERSLLQEDWKRCMTKIKDADRNEMVPSAPQSFKWATLPVKDVPAIKAHLADGGDGSSGNALWDCLRETDAPLVDKFRKELLREWPSAEEDKGLGPAIKLLGHCSEMMLFPPGALLKGATYAEELENWAKLYPRSQLKVIHTDELSDTRSAQRVMDETFRFLGLAPIDVGNETRMCVHGKAGVMDVLNAFEGSVRIGDKTAAPEKLNVGACDTVKLVQGMHIDRATGAMHHDIEPELLKRMRAYYEPSNQRLYKFIGRDLGW